MSEFRIVTISNRVPHEWYYTYEQLFKSAGGNEILVLGQQPGEYTGLSDKPRILHKAISDGLIKEEIIVFVDAWDVVFADTLEEIISKYRAFQTSIVIGAEKNCFPTCFKKEYDKLPQRSSYKYLNSGVIIGETEAIYEVLNAMDAPNLPVDYYDSRKNCNYHFNDQAYYMDMFLRQPVTMELDNHCFIAQNMQDVLEDELDFSGAGILNKEIGTKPSIIHWNGSSKDKWSRNKILKHLNLL
jgi:hypothetical protein